MDINVGDRVRPYSREGLYLSTAPHNGSPQFEATNACVFKGQGVVLETRDIVIDYDVWPDWAGHNLGKVNCRNCLVRCDAGEGWGSEGAVVKV